MSSEINKEKFLTALNNNNFEKANKLVFHNDIDIFNNFGLYLNEAKNSDNEDFITTYLNLFLKDSVLHLEKYSCLKELEDYISFYQNKKNYNIIEKILKNNYNFNIDNMGTLCLNSGFIFIFIESNDIKGFELTLKYMIEEDLVIDIIGNILKRNQTFLPYIFEKHEYLIQESLEINPKLKNNPLFQKYLIQYKFKNF